MIYLKNISKDDLKNWLVKECGKDILKVFEIKQKRVPEREFLIRTRPHILNHPLRLWIWSCVDDELKPTGQICIRSLENNTFHHVSSLKLFHDKLALEMHNLLKELVQIADNITFPHLNKLMTKMHFRFDKIEGTKEHPTMGSFSYVPVEHFPPSDPDSRFDEQDPTVNFNLKTMTTNSYIDGSKKQEQMWNKATSYIESYCKYITGKGIKCNYYTIINDKTASKAMDHALDLMKNEIAKKKDKQK